MEKIKVSPHWEDKDSTGRIMNTVTLSLLPALIGACYFFGYYVILVIAAAIGAALLSDILWKVLIQKKKWTYDGSAVLTGLLLAFVLPPSIPLWMAALGSFLAIFLVKELFGGIGFNILNPALAARAILLASFPVQMTTFIQPNYGISAVTKATPLVDAITTATPLIIIKEGLNLKLPGYSQLLIGQRAGCLGETSTFLLLLGAAILFLRKIISWQIPVFYIVTVFLCSILFHQNPFYQIISGGLILGAFFMATDYVTSPLFKKGQIIFGIGCGLITSLIRFKGGYPEGVCYAILFMNLLVPIIDKYTVPRTFGH